jgi:hypothetical protein
MDREVIETAGCNVLGAEPRCAIAQRSTPVTFSRIPVEIPVLLRGDSIQVNRTQPAEGCQFQYCKGENDGNP